MWSKIFKLGNIKTIGISGHTKPDGDCTGACLALKGYLESIKDQEKIKRIDVYSEPISDSFMFLKGSEELLNNYDEDIEYDLFISLDCASEDRLGKASKYFKSAKETLNIDHHISNTNFADTNYVLDDASSTCEVLYDLLGYKSIDLNIAEALYLGIAHDTGIFKHSSTSSRTMEIAGKLMDKGINFTRIVDKTFFQKTHNQNQILGKALIESNLILDGKGIVSFLDKETIDFYKLERSELEGIIDQLRITKGVEVAIFIYENQDGTFKISMRSNNDINVSEVAVKFNGGGHVKAAGCTMSGPVDLIIEKIGKAIELQLA